MPPRTPRVELSHNFEATADPTVNDDETQAYEVGSQWINTVAGTTWQCVDATAGAASWVNTAASTSFNEDWIVTTLEPLVVINNAGNVVRTNP